MNEHRVKRQTIGNWNLEMLYTIVTEIMQNQTYYHKRD